MINEAGREISKESTNLRGEMSLDGHYHGTNRFYFIYRVTRGL
jgi:hypothetical protein